MNCVQQIEKITLWIQYRTLHFEWKNGGRKIALYTYDTMWYSLGASNRISLQKNIRRFGWFCCGRWPIKEVWKGGGRSNGHFFFFCFSICWTVTDREFNTRNILKTKYCPWWRSVRWREKIHIYAYVVKTRKTMSPGNYFSTDIWCFWIEYFAYQKSFSFLSEHSIFFTFRSVIYWRSAINFQMIRFTYINICINALNTFSFFF